MTTTRVIFIDIDGPLIPYKAKWLPQIHGKEQMDPCAVSLLNQLLELDTSIKMVISSSHRSWGIEHCKSLFAANNIQWLVHDDWYTPRKMSSERYHEIKWWLDDHPEVTHHAALEDLPLHLEFVPGAVKCDEYEGFSYLNFLECRLHLDLLPKNMTKKGLQEHINYHKKRHIWNVMNNVPDSWKLREPTEEVFPRIIEDKE